MCQFHHSFKYVALKFYYYRLIIIKSYKLNIYATSSVFIETSYAIRFWVSFSSIRFLYSRLWILPQTITRSHLKISRIAGGTPPTNAVCNLIFQKTGSQPEADP